MSACLAAAAAPRMSHCDCVTSADSALLRMLAKMTPLTVDNMLCLQCDLLHAELGHRSNLRSV
jgi:hypothetical protein